MPSQPRIRRFDPARSRTALTAQWSRVGAWVSAISREQLAAPTPISGWAVSDLLGHFVIVADLITNAILVAEGRQGGQPSGDLVSWASGTRGRADNIDTRSRAAARQEISPVAAFEAALAALDGIDWPRSRPELVVPWPVTTPDGPRPTERTIRLADLVVSRIVESVVHADDLDRALAGVAGEGHEPFEHDRTALAIAVRMLADTLAVRIPGHSVELRVPPHAAVQCVPGPRHTRGTPPSVVETDPTTWLRLATGRLTWSEAEDTGALRASGQRSDLSPYLPVLS